MQFTEEELKHLHPGDIAAYNARESWMRTARAKQLLPPGDWDTLLAFCGRFFGKSRMLSEYAWFEAYRIPNLRIHALAPTIGDVRRVTFEGPCGLLALTPPELVADYNRSLHELSFTTGSKIIGFSATEEADRLRGPQAHTLIFDEAAAADKPAGNLETAYKVAALGCRLPYPDGTPSRKLIATTPRPIGFLKNLAKRPGVVVVRGTSYENLKNVAPSIQNELLSMEGTRFGRQELLAEFLDDSEHAIFQRKWFRLWPNGKKLPEFQYILMSLDTAMSDDSYDLKTGDTDFSCCGVFGIFNTRECFTEAELKKLGVRSKYAALLCDLWNERLGFPELLEKTRDTYRKKWGGPAHGTGGTMIGPRGGNHGRRPDMVLIEAKNSGISLRQTLMQYGIPTWPYDPRRQSKTMRAHAASPLVMQGMLFVPESSQADRKGQFRNWAEPMVDQMCTFAGEGSIAHDDAVDVCTQSMLYLSERGTFQATPLQHGYPDPDEKDEMDKREAIAIADKEKRAKYSPYGS